jgi:hypothetical protein
MMVTTFAFTGGIVLLLNRRNQSVGRIDREDSLKGGGDPFNDIAIAPSRAQVADVA